MTVKQLNARSAKEDRTGLGATKADYKVAVLRSILRKGHDLFDSKHTVVDCSGLLRKNEKEVDGEWVWFKAKSF